VIAVRGVAVARSFCSRPRMLCTRSCDCRSADCAGTERDGSRKAMRFSGAMSRWVACARLICSAATRVARKSPPPFMRFGLSANAAGGGAWRRG